MIFLKKQLITLLTCTRVTTKPKCGGGDSCSPAKLHASLPSSLPLPALEPSHTFQHFCQTHNHMLSGHFLLTSSWSDSHVCEGNDSCKDSGVSRASCPGHGEENPSLSLYSGLSNSFHSQGLLPQCRAHVMAMSWVPWQLSSRQDLFPCLSGALVLICNVCLIYH